MSGILEPTYRERLLDPYLDELTAQLPALVVVGPRAGGKTTTISRRARSIVRLDRPVEAAAFEADPDAALRGLAEPVLLDEWQAVPGVLGAVRRAVDAEPRPGRFLLTGSARAEFGGATWPGTGRVVRVTMYPMTVREQLGRVSRETFFDKVAAETELAVPRDPPDLRGYLELALAGGFPQPALFLDGAARHAWLASYIDDLLTRDIEQLEQPKTKGRDSLRLRRYFEAYALNSAGACDHKTIYDAAGIGRVTAGAYETLLTDLFVVDRLPAWTTNRLQRLVHKPKRYIVDAALSASVLRLDVDGVIRDGNLLGRLLETFVVAQLRAEAAVSAASPRLHHLRTDQGRREVDVLVELGGQRVIGVEIKAAAAPRSDDARSLLWLRDQLGERFVMGVLLHTGPRAFRLEDRLVAAPIAALWA